MSGLALKPCCRSARPVHSRGWLLALDDHQVMRVVVADEEQDRHRAIAAHQFLVDVDTVLLQLVT